MSQMISEKKVNHCFGASMAKIFEQLSLPEELIFPSESFFAMDPEQKIISMDGFLHSLIVDHSQEEYKQIYRCAEIEFDFYESLSQHQLQSAWNEDKRGLVLMDTYECPWCKFYRKVHFDHVCVLKCHLNRYIIDDVLFEKKVMVSYQNLMQICKGVVLLYAKKKTYDNYKEIFKNELIVSEKFNRLQGTSNEFANLMQKNKRIILEQFDIKNLSSFLVANVFKQYAVRTNMHIKFLEKCSKEDAEFQKIIRIEKNIEKLYDFILNNFLKISLSRELRIKERYFDKIIELLQNLKKLEEEKKLLIYEVR